MIAQNEAARIERSLRSVAWADEIVVIDGGSTDDTVAIAERCGARVEVHPWPGNFAVQIQRSLDATTGDWVFRLDADEVVMPDLAEQLRRAASRSDAADAYRVRRRNYFLGRWIRHGGWWPDPQLRLVRRPLASVRGAPGHETLHAEAWSDTRITLLRTGPGDAGSRPGGCSRTPRRRSCASTSCSPAGATERTDSSSPVFTRW
jgi:hypothetical protein